MTRCKKKLSKICSQNIIL